MNKKNNAKISEVFVSLVIPLILIPLGLFSALYFGHGITNLIMGLAFLICAIKSANPNEKKMMLILTIFALIFEEVNVLSGAYVYSNTKLVPIWVGLGWSILGLYIHKNSKNFAHINDKLVYGVAFLIYVSIWLLYGAQISQLTNLALAISTIFLLSKIDKNAAHHFFASLMGMVIEFSGTSLGVWTYFDEAGKPIAVPLLTLSMAYAAVIAFCFWISERAKIAEE